MHPKLIKAQIRMQGTTPASVANALGVSRSAQVYVITARSQLARTLAAIARAAGLPVAALWPPKVPSGFRASGAAHAQGAGHEQIQSQKFRSRFLLAPHCTQEHAERD